MEKRKVSVVKSNSTSEAKKNYSSTQEHNKESRSSAEFQANITVTGGFQHLKRRGVYVEKKTIKIPINIEGVRSSDARASAPKPPARHVRRPDKNRFLANVLTLLSKSTAGTQCSDSNSNEQLMKVEKTKQSLKKKREEITYDDPVPTPPARRRARYKSKSLNNYVDDEIDSLIVLRSTKEIIQTPSNNSECNNSEAVSTHTELEDMEWTAPYPPADRQDLNTMPAKASHGKNVSLISSQEKTGFEENRNDKNIYNFFLDVIKTTLSVCNVSHQLDGQPLCTNSSNGSLVIDEDVADKLKIQEIKEDEPKAPYNESHRPCNSKCYYSVMPSETQAWGENFKPEFSKQHKVESPKKKKKQRIISNSFQNKKAKPPSTSNRPRPVPNMPMYTTTSMPVPSPKKKPMKLKRNKKSDFIDSIKQELIFDKEDVYEKPNFFQALKTIARNKKKQSVNFETYIRPSDENVELRSRKVLSAKSSLKKQPRNPKRWQHAVVPNTYQPNFPGYNQQVSVTIYETSSEESIHSNYSLEVIGYDDETEVKTNMPAHRPSMTQEFSPPSLNFSDN